MNLDLIKPQPHEIIETALLFDRDDPQRHQLIGLLGHDDEALQQLRRLREAEH